MGSFRNVLSFLYLFAFLGGKFWVSGQLKATAVAGTEAFGEALRNNEQLEKDRLGIINILWVPNFSTAINRNTTARRSASESSFARHFGETSASQGGHGPHCPNTGMDDFMSCWGCLWLTPPLSSLGLQLLHVMFFMGLLLKKWFQPA